MRNFVVLTLKTLDYQWSQMNAMQYIRRWRLQDCIARKTFVFSKVKCWPLPITFIFAYIVELRSLWLPWVSRAWVICPDFNQFHIFQFFSSFFVFSLFFCPKMNRSCWLAVGEEMISNSLTRYFLNWPIKLLDGHVIKISRTMTGCGQAAVFVNKWFTAAEV